MPPLAKPAFRGRAAAIAVAALAANLLASSSASAPPCETRTAPPRVLGYSAKQNAVLVRRAYALCPSEELLRTGRINVSEAGEVGFVVLEVVDPITVTPRAAFLEQGDPRLWKELMARHPRAPEGSDVLDSIKADLVVLRSLPPTMFRLRSVELGSAADAAAYLQQAVPAPGRSRPAKACQLRWRFQTAEQRAHLVVEGKGGEAVVTSVAWGPGVLLDVSGEWFRLPSADAFAILQIFSTTTAAHGKAGARGPPVEETWAVIPAQLGCL